MPALPPPSFPPAPPLSFPPVVSGNPVSFSSVPLFVWALNGKSHGFPIENVGNDSVGLKMSGRTGGLKMSGRTAGDSLAGEGRGEGVSGHDREVGEEPM